MKKFPGAGFSNCGNPKHTETVIYVEPWRLIFGTCVPIRDHVGHNKRIEDEKDNLSREAMFYLDHLYRVARYLAEEPDEAHDLVQETYARALGSYDRFTPGSNMKAWLSKILYNLFFDHYRQKKKWVSMDDSSNDEEYRRDYREKMPAENPGPEGHLLANELATKITEALKTIPEEFRMPIVMVDMGDFSYAEAAEILSCPVGTIRSRLSRGRRLVYSQLKGYVDMHDEGREKKWNARKQET